MHRMLALACSRKARGSRPARHLQHGMHLRLRRNPGVVNHEADDPLRQIDELLRVARRGGGGGAVVRCTTAVSMHGDLDLLWPQQLDGRHVFFRLGIVSEPVAQMFV